MELAANKRAKLATDREEENRPQMKRKRISHGWTLMNTDKGKGNIHFC
jgi:hypothetical protein